MPGSWITVAVALFVLGRLPTGESQTVSLDCSTYEDLVATSDKQFFASPNYPSNYDANDLRCYRVTATTNSYYVLLGLTAFSVDGTGNCDSTIDDVVLVYDGTTTSGGSFLVQFCNGNYDTNQHRVFTMPSSTGLVVFNTSPSTESTGFQFYYLEFNNNPSACGDTYSFDTAGATLYHPGPALPGQYNADTTDCSFSVTASSPVRFLTVDIIMIDMENADGSCTIDTLVLYDGSSNSGTVLATLCGNQISNSATTTTYTSSGPSFYFEFNAGSSSLGYYYGFIIKYTDSSPDYACSSTNTLTPTTEVQTISSPNYPSNYAASSESCWTLNITSNIYATILIAFTAFDVHGTASSCRVNQGHDVVAIFEGGDDSATLLAALCNNNFNADATRFYVSSVQLFYLYFGTSSSNEAAGFRMKYLYIDTSTSTSCDDTVNPPLTGMYLYGPELPSAYSDSTTCSYTISSSVGGTIQADIILLDLQNSDGTCSYDRLVLYDGTANTDPELATLCGNSLTAEESSPYTSTGSNMFVEFTSDATGTSLYYGYIMKFTDLPLTYTCANTINALTASSEVQTFASNNYPANYNANSNECWSISPSTSGKTVLIAFASFAINSATVTGSCLIANKDDIVVLFTDGTTTTGTSTTFCNYNFVYDSNHAYASANGFLVYFESDNANEDTGFQIQYLEIDTSYSQTCSASLTATTSGFYHQSDNLPGYFTNGVTCSYTITTSSATNAAVEASITFTDMRNSDGTCDQDLLSIYDGTSNTATRLGILCGNPKDNPDGSTFSSTDVNMFIEFVSSNNGLPETYLGFVIKFKEISVPSACGDGLSLNAATTSATLTSVNYPSNYDASQTCQWTITAPTNNAVKISFSAFVLEDHTYCSYDKLSVYDGTSTSDSLLNEYCGSTVPPDVQSTGTSMYLRFVSDATYQFTGFSLTYIAVDISYPACKSGYTSYTAASGTLATAPTISSQNYPSDYSSNLDEYFLIENTSPAGDLVLALKAMNVERSTDCIYDRIVIYSGGCTTFSITSTMCGTYLHRLELSGSEYLVHFHTDSSVVKSGFSMAYYIGTHGTGAPTTTTTTVGPPVQEEINLMNNVLTDYSSSNIPSRDLNTPLETTVDIYLVGINDLDEVAQMLTSTALFDVKWQDEGLKWSTSKSSNIIQLLIPQNDIWRPDLALLNGFTAITEMGASFMYVVVENNGSCTWRPYQIMKTTCAVDMTYYPYDTQSCDLQFGTWTSSSGQVSTKIGRLGLQMHENFVKNAEWSLLSTSMKNETVNNQAVVTFTLKIRRNPDFVTYYMSLPVILLAFISAFIFVLPTDSGEKSGVAITIFLSFLVYVVIIFQRMPPNSDKLSRFAVYIILLAILSALSVMVAVCELRLSSMDAEKKKIPKSVEKVTKWFMKIINVLMCVTDTQKYRAGTWEQKKSVDWKDVVSAIDVVACIIFTSITVILTLYFMLDLSFS